MSSVWTALVRDTQPAPAIPRPAYRRQSGTKPTSILLPPEQQAWLRANGGSFWVREQIAKAMKESR